MTATPKRRMPLIFSRFVNFLKIFRHNRRGMLGIIILVLATLIASFGPLLTPYDPVWQTYVTKDYAVPTWFRYLPGGEGLSENFEPFAQPGFPTSDSLQEWNFTKTTSSATVELRYDKVMGKPGENYGCAAIDFSRAEGGFSYPREVKATLANRFFYPYSGYPGLFRASAAVLTEGAEYLGTIKIEAFFKRLEENNNITSYRLWDKRISRDSAFWISPSPEISSYASKGWVTKYFGDPTIDPVKTVFNATTEYEYVIEVTFEDNKRYMDDRDIQVTVYIDDLRVQLYGTAFGLLGADHYGRDIFTQAIYGARISLMVGFLAAIISVFIGLFVGLVAGYIGGVVDEVTMRFTDMLLVIPGLPLLIVLIMVFKEVLQQPTYVTVTLLLGILGWMGFARVVRSSVLSLRERPFVEAAKAVGAGKLHIIGRHILPNVISLVYVSLALSVPTAILSEAALSWLGLYDPNVMSWGRMLFDVQNNHGVERWWWVLPPGLAIAAVSLSFVLIGYALDEILNPRLRMRR